jgi:outer membrane protein assembly factor BamB
MNRRLWCGLAFAPALVACRSPTQISVTVQTDVSCTQVTTTSFTSGELGAIESAPPTTESTRCNGGHLGTLVLVPSEDDNAEVGFKVVTALNGETIDTCSGAAAANDKSCIVARRAIRYLPHTPLDVVVDMSTNCEGIVCDPHSTCFNAECKSAAIDDPSLCAPECTGSVLGPAADAGGDATASDGAVDATLSDGAVDATLSDAAVDSTLAVDSGDDAPSEDAEAPTEASTFDALVLGCDLGGLQPNSPYPMEAYCPSGRSRSPLAGPASTPTPVQEWFVDLYGYGYPSPSIAADGTIFIGSVGLPLADGGVGYVGGAVEGIHPDGGVSWTYAPDAGASFDQVPVIAADSTLRFWDINLPGHYTVLGLDGTLLHLVAATPSRGGVTIVSGGTMYVPDNSGNLVAYAGDGSVLWSTANVSNDYCFPSVATSGVIFAEDNAKTASAVFADGSVEWHQAIDSGASANDPYLSPVVIAPDGTLRIYDGNGDLWSLDAQTGLGIWHHNFALPGDIEGLAVGDDVTTYLGTREGLVAVGPSGALIKSQPGDFGPPVIDVNGDVYAFCNDNDVCSFDGALSASRWEITLPNVLGYDPGAKPVIGPGNMIYVVSMVIHESGRLHAIGPGP